MNFAQHLRKKMHTDFYQYKGPSGLIDMMLPDLLFRRSSFKSWSNGNLRYMDNIMIVEHMVHDYQITITFNDVEWKTIGKAHSGSAFVLGNIVKTKTITLDADQKNAEKAAVMIANYVDQTAKNRWAAEAELEKKYAEETVGKLMRDEYRERALDAARSTMTVQ